MFDRKGCIVLSLSMAAIAFSVYAIVNTVWGWL
jgi:hypothetical protein